MSYVWFSSLNETLKQIDLSAGGWLFIYNGGGTDHYDEIGDDFELDWIAVRRHCGGLLILRRTYHTDNVMTIEEISVRSAKNWLKLNNQLSIPGYPELEVV